MSTRAPCTTEFCERPQRAKGLCNPCHGYALRHNGHVEPIRSSSKPVLRLFSRVDMPSQLGCWTWTGSTSQDGYGHFRVNRRVVLVHRFSWEFHHGPIPKGLLVCHKCDNPPCVNPAHLFLGTSAENTADASRKGRMRTPRGEKNPSSKLTDIQRQEIVDAKSGGESAKDIAKRYDVGESTVFRLVREAKKDAE